MQNTTLYNELKNGSLGPVTLLAPTEAAFANLTEEEWKTLEDKTLADELLRRHIVTGERKGFPLIIGIFQLYIKQYCSYV